MIDTIATHLGAMKSVVSTEIQGAKVIAVVDINGERFTLSLDFGGNFPAELPEIFLLEPESYGLLPHVCWQGKVCYSDGEGVSIDTSQPLAVAEYAVTNAISTLSIEKDKRENLFFDEFEGYWNRQKSAMTCYTFIEPDNKVKIIRVSLYTKAKVPIACFDDTSDSSLSQDYQFYSSCKSGKTHMKGIYLPLGHAINPPLPRAKLDIEYLNEILHALSDDNKELWDAIIKKRKLPNEALHLLISHPRPSGELSLYGVTIPHGINWLNGRTKNYQQDITPLTIKRHTPDYLLQRSGGDPELSDKHVVIIGCGSIGGRIAELLIMGGVKNLSLLDSDNLSTDNIFRHVLSSRYIGHNKAEALEEELKSNFPYINITATPKNASKLNKFMINHDVVIDATGNPTLGRELNKSHRNLNDDNAPLLLTVWTEALGLGGHAVLSDGKTNGCLHCLFHKDNSERLSSIFNFVEENQIVSRNLTGCGGAFTPFSALDAAKTAEIAARMVIDALKPMDAIRTYQWWRSNDEAAIKADIKTTPWYLNCEEEPKDKVDAIFNEGCPVCRKN